MARCTACPVARSHTTVVSRWLVMPIAAMSFAVSARLLQRLAADRDGRGPDVLRLVLDPARGRKMLREFLLRRRPRSRCRRETRWRARRWCPDRWPARRTWCVSRRCSRFCCVARTADWGREVKMLRRRPSPPMSSPRKRGPISQDAFVAPSWWLQLTPIRRRRLWVPGRASLARDDGRATPPRSSRRRRPRWSGRS